MRTVRQVALRVSAVVLAVVGLGSACAPAAPPPVTYPSARPLTYAVMVPVPRPGYLVPVVDPAFSTSVVRVSDAAVFGSSDQFLRNAYAKTEPWNADGSRVLLSYSKTGYVLDGSSYRLVGRVPLNSVGDAVWSAVDPDVIYRSQGNALVRVSASSGVVTPVATFAGYSSVVVGGGEGSPSNDGRYLTLVGRSAAGESALVFDLVAGRLVGERLLGPAGSVDWVAMSQSGASVVV